MEGDRILSNDLVMEILSRLAVRDLLRCRSVSKEWLDLIDSPSFISKHYQVQFSIRAVNGSIPYIVHNSFSEKLNLFSIQEGDVHISDMTDGLERDSEDVLPWQFESSQVCVNGIVCLSLKMGRRSRSCERSLGLWNPATREFKIVAIPIMHTLIFEVVGFGFDLSSKDFKILGAYTLVGEDKWGYRCYEIYSLKSNSWKSLRAPSADAGLFRSDGYLNGVFYWDSRLKESGQPLVILSFSFSSEEFKVSDPPEDAYLLDRRCYPFQIKVTLYKESIGLFISHEVQETSSLYRVDLWVVTQFDHCGVPLSWKHLLSVGPPAASYGLCVSTTLINGDLLLEVDLCNGLCRGLIRGCNCDPRVEFWVYKTSTSELKKLGIKLFSTYYSYVESLFPLSKRLLS